MKKIFSLLFIIIFVVGISAVMAQPPAPTYLTAEVISSGNSKYVKLLWTGIPSPSTGTVYEIYRRNGGLNDTTPFVKIGSTWSSNYKDMHVHTGNTYSYNVKAKNSTGVSDPSNSVEVTVPAPTPIVKGVVAGTVVKDDDNSPLSNAKVLLFSSSNAAGYAYVYTNSAGVFSKSVPAGSYYLQTSKHGFVSEYFDNVATKQEATLIVVAGNDSQNVSIGLASVVPPTMHAVSGSVADSLGNPLRAWIKVYKVRNNSHHWRYYPGKTDSLGNYSINVKEGDTVVVYASPFDHNYFGEYYDDKRTFSEADRIGVSAPVANVNFVLSHKPVYANGITGTVSDTSQTGVESHLIAFRKQTASPSSGWHWKRYGVISDSLGNYEFSNLVPGDYIMLAKPMHGYRPTYFRYDGTTTMNWRNADSIPVAEAGVVSGINFTVKAFSDSGNAAVIGSVKDALGNALVGSSIIALDANLEVAGYSFADETGSFVLSGLVPGDYKVMANAIGFNDSRVYNITLDYVSHTSANLNFVIEPSGITSNEDKSAVVSNFELKQNYPNPFNPSTTISFSIPQQEKVTLKIYNVLGNVVSVLIDEVKSAGNYSISFDGSQLSSGVYFYKLEAGSYSSTKKLTLMK